MQGCPTQGSAASDEKAQAVIADVRKHGVQGEAFKADQAHSAQISRLVGDVVDRFGKLDILVNNAAVAWLGARVGADNYDAEKMNQQLGPRSACARRTRGRGRLQRWGSGAAGLDY